MSACVRARNCRPRPPTSMSPTPWANWGCSIGYRRSCSWEVRWSEHGGQNPIEAIKLGASIVHGPHVFNFADVYEALDSAGGAKPADTQEALVKQLGQLLADPAARDLSLAAAERRGLRSSAARSIARWPRSSPISCNYASKWGRRMHEPAFWYRPSSWMSRFLMPLAAVYGAIAGHRLQREGLDAGIPVLCVGNYHVGGAGKTPTVLALVKLSARTRRDAGRAQPWLRRTIARTGHGRSRSPRRCRRRRRAADDGADGPGGRCARSHQRRGIGTVARRHRDRDGRWLPESGGHQGCLADRDRWRSAASAMPACFPRVPCVRRCRRKSPVPMH